MRKRLLFVQLAVAAASFALAGGHASAQLATTEETATGVLGMLATLDVESLIPLDDPVLTDPAANESATSDPPHLPKGSNFKLFGTAKRDVDPENPFNEVISFDTTPPDPILGPFPIAGAFRKLGNHVKVDMLDNQVELKYFFVGRTCAGDGPRIQLGIDADGDGKFDGNAFGHLGDKPFGGGCAMNQWVFEDMTNTVQKWDLSQFPGSGAFCPPFFNAMICSWQDMENFFDTAHPNHQVLNIVLVDDAASFAPTSQGCAFFDLVSAGARTLTSHSDTGGDGKDPNNC
jgi:hypothetical protein